MKTKITSAAHGTVEVEWEWKTQAGLPLAEIHVIDAIADAGDGPWALDVDEFEFIAEELYDLENEQELRK
jgi:hypothetical protein